jgi:hypothetical protein
MAPRWWRDAVDAVVVAGAAAVVSGAEGMASGLAEVSGRMVVFCGTVVDPGPAPVLPLHPARISARTTTRARLMTRRRIRRRLSSPGSQ